MRSAAEAGRSHHLRRDDGLRHRRSLGASLQSNPPMRQLARRTIVSGRCVLHSRGGVAQSGRARGSPAPLPGRRADRSILIASNDVVVGSSPTPATRRAGATGLSSRKRATPDASPCSPNSMILEMARGRPGATVRRRRGGMADSHQLDRPARAGPPRVGYPAKQVRLLTRALGGPMAEGDPDGPKVTRKRVWPVLATDRP